MKDANTQDPAEVCGTETPQEAAVVISGMQVARRTIQNVGAALNGDPIAPSSERARHVRREAQREGGYVGWEGILEADYRDLMDGVPRAQVRATHERALAAIDAWAPAVRLDRPLGAYQVAEMRAEQQLNLVQRVLDTDPENPDAYEKVARAGRGYIGLLTDLLAFCDHRSTVLRGKPRRVYGARTTERQRLRVHS